MPRERSFFRHRLLFAAPHGAAFSTGERQSADTFLRPFYYKQRRAE
jgi:hypothetical protein